MQKINAFFSPALPATEFAGSRFDDDAWADEAERDSAEPLVHLCGAAALAILALATASLVLL